MLLNIYLLTCLLTYLHEIRSGTDPRIAGDGLPMHRSDKQACDRRKCGPLWSPGVRSLGKLKKYFKVEQMGRTGGATSLIRSGSVPGVDKHS